MASPETVFRDMVSTVAEYSTDVTQVVAVAEGQVLGMVEALPAYSDEF